MSSEYSTPSKQKSKWKIHLSTSAKENPFGQTPYTPLLIAKSPRVRPFQEEQLSPPKERSTEISTESPIKLRDELLCHRGGAEEVRRLVKESNIFPKKGKGVLVPIIPKVLCHRRAQTETFILGESKQLSDKEGSTLPDIPYLHSFSVRKCLLDTSSTCINPRLLQMTAGKYPPRKVRLTPSPNLMAKYQNPMKTRFKVNTTQLIRKQERQLELDQIIIQNKGSVVRYHKEGDEPNIQEFNRIHSKNRLEEYSNTYVHTLYIYIYI